MIKSVDGNVVGGQRVPTSRATAAPGFVRTRWNRRAVGLFVLTEGDDYTTYFIAVQPVLAQWGLNILP